MIKTLSDENSLDLILMLTDSLDIVNDKTDIMLSEGIKPPGYMKMAAKSGIIKRDRLPGQIRPSSPAALARARQLINGQEMTLSSVKRLRNFAEDKLKNLDAEDFKNDTVKVELLLWGIASSSGSLQRVIKWANSKIKVKEKNKDA